MDPTLPLDPRPRLPLGAPFTPAMARRAGVTRHEIDRRVRAGTVRHLLRGVYVDAAADDTPGLRARAVALLVAREAIVVDRTAAWVHGVDVPTGRPRALPPVDVLGRHRRALVARDVERIDGLCLTTPLRTALDLGRALAPEAALAALDGLLRTGRLDHAGLLRAVAALEPRAGVRQLRFLASLADGRAQGAAESVLRLRWCLAGLPTPIPGAEVLGARVALALPVQRFAAVLAESVARSDLVRAEHSGWRVLVLPGQRVLCGDPDLLRQRLEQEFHRHLLAEVS